MRSLSELDVEMRAIQCEISVQLVQREDWSAGSGGVVSGGRGAHDYYWRCVSTVFRRFDRCEQLMDSVMHRLTQVESSLHAAALTHFGDDAPRLLAPRAGPRPPPPVAHRHTAILKLLQSRFAFLRNVQAKMQRYLQCIHQVKSNIFALYHQVPARHKIASPHAADAAVPPPVASGPDSFPAPDVAADCAGGHVDQDSGAAPLTSEEDGSPLQSGAAPTTLHSTNLSSSSVGYEDILILKDAILNTTALVSPPASHGRLARSLRHHYMKDEASAADAGALYDDGGVVGVKVFPPLYEEHIGLILYLIDTGRVCLATLRKLYYFGSKTIVKGYLLGKLREFHLLGPDMFVASTSAAPVAAATDDDEPLVSPSQFSPPLSSPSAPRVTLSPSSARSPSSPPRSDPPSVTSSHSTTPARDSVELSRHNSAAPAGARFIPSSSSAFHTVAAPG